MGSDVQGRRREPEMVDGALRPPTEMEPGDYCGPLVGFTGDKPMVTFRKPHADHPDTPRRGQIIQHVCSPPHTFTENADGTLTIDPSISDFPSQRTPDTESDGWHGYLERGVWRQV